MEVLYVLIAVSVTLAAGFTVACVRAIRSGQFDDLESPRWRLLFDPTTSPGRGGPREDASPDEGIQTGARAPRSPNP